VVNKKEGTLTAPFVILKEYKRITEKNVNNAFKRGKIEPE
jgi:hypothetical protein